MESEEENQESSEKNTEKGKILIAVVILAVLISAGIVIYRHYKNAVYETYTYNGFSFEKIGPLWYTTVQSGGRLYSVPLHYLPRDLINVSISGRVDFFNNGSKVYIAFDPLANSSEMPYIYVVSVNLETNLLSFFGRQPEVACTRQDNASCINSTIISCGKTLLPIIQIEAEGSPEVLFRGNCVILKGSRENLIMAADRFMLRYYGIM
ncbi:MAG: hypothetical protein NTZ02_03600 [Candidatus Woesearchaeota archaeon]|nr:hypothetical protein [Candidatus Woesearchaeota archaeon]